MKLKNTFNLLLSFFMILSLITIVTATTSNYVWWNDNGDNITAHRFITSDETLNVSFWADSIGHDFPMHVVYTLRLNGNFHKFIEVNGEIFNGTLQYNQEQYGNTILNSTHFNEFGEYTIKLSSWDSTGTAIPAELHFTVLDDEEEENQAPIAVDDVFNVSVNSAYTTLNVLVNDYDPDSDEIVIADVNTPSNGDLSFNNAVIFYQPHTDFTGSDIFQYTIEDTNGAQASANITINVLDEEEENQAPELIQDIPSQEIFDGDSFDVFNLYEYFNDTDNTTLEFDVIGGSELNYYIANSGNVYVGYRDAEIPVEETVTFTANDAINSIVNSNLVTFRVNEIATQNNLFIDDFTCLDRPIPQSGTQLCQVHVVDNNNVSVSGVEVEIFYDNHSSIEVCTTNSYGYCPLKFNVSQEVGEYTIYAIAEKENYEFDANSAPHITFEVRYRRYALDNFYIHNDIEDFGNPFAQTLNFFRSEGIYIEFLIRDLDSPNQPIVTHQLDSELILYNSNNFNNNIEFDLINFNSDSGVYWYDLEFIPLHDNYLGENFVLGFVMNSQNQTADHIAHINIFNNVPIWQEIPTQDLEETEETTLDLNDFVSDIEDDYYGIPLIFEVTTSTQNIIDYELNNDELTIFALIEGNITLDLRATDHNGDFSDTTVLITINQSEEHLNAYFEVEDRVKTNTEILFDASGSSGNITSYVWEFINLNETTIDSEIYHVFNRIGFYDITLTVYDSEGNSDSYTKELEIDKAGACYDGLDNDGDGYIDMEDPTCIATNGRTEHALNEDLESGLVFGHIDIYATSGYYAKPGEEVFANIKIRNPTEQKINDLRVSLTVADLGVKIKSSKFSLSSGDSKNLNMYFFVPYFAWDEEYPVKITVANDDLIRSKYRFITVEST